MGLRWLPSLEGHHMDKGGTGRANLSVRKSLAWHIGHRTVPCSINRTQSMERSLGLRSRVTTVTARPDASVKMHYVALLSGGKDSCFNLLHCLRNGHKLVASASLGPEPGQGLTISLP